MNLADLKRRRAQEPDAPSLTEPLDASTLVAQLGSEVASTLSSALDRVHNLVATGRIDRSSLRALSEEIDLARRAAIMGQQVVRLANGQVPLAAERMDLTALVRDALRQRSREIEARGIEVRQILAPAEVLSDATMLFSFLQSLLDWCFEHTVSRLDLSMDIKNWPAHARLIAGFFYLPQDEAQTVEADAAGPLKLGDAGLAGLQNSNAHAAQLNTMSWRLLQQTATVLDLRLLRLDSAGRSELHVEFPQTLTAQLDGIGTSQVGDALLGSGKAQPLARRQVLVVAAKRELRNVIREALRPMGAMLDLVDSAAQAKTWCQTTLPHAVIYEEAAAGETLEQLRSTLLAETPGIAFLCIAAQGKAFEVLNVGGRQIASVGRDAVIESLPAALLFELSRHT